MAFFNSAVGVLQTLVIALGAGLALAERLLRESGVPGRPVRLLGLSVSNPAQDLPPEQHELYRQLRLEF